MFMSESNFKEDRFDSDCNVLMTMSETVKSVYALDLQSMGKALLDDSSLMELVKQHISSNGQNDTIYTYKSVENVELIHKNN